MDTQKPKMSDVSRVKTDKQVKFSDNCKAGCKCKVCDKTYKSGEIYQTTSFHQFKSDITSYVIDSSGDMIADIGAPNSVIGAKDVKTL